MIADISPCSVLSLTSSRRLRLRRLIVVVVALFSAFVLVTAPMHVATVQAQDFSPNRPARTCYGVYHLVRPGQTIYSIAGAYGTTAYRIRLCNGLASSSVYSGQTLLIPIYRSR